MIQLERNNHPDFGVSFPGSKQFRDYCSSVWIVFSFTLSILKFMLPLFFFSPCYQQKEIIFKLTVIASFRRAWHSWPMFGKPGPEVLTVSYQPVNHWSSLALWDHLTVTLGSSGPGSSDEVQVEPPGLVPSPGAGGGVGNIGVEGEGPVAKRERSFLFTFLKTLC